MFKKIFKNRIKKNIISELFSFSLTRGSLLEQKKKIEYFEEGIQELLAKIEKSDYNKNIKFSNSQINLIEVENSLKRLILKIHEILEYLVILNENNFENIENKLEEDKLKINRLILESKLLLFFSEFDLEKLNTLKEMA